MIEPDLTLIASHLEGLEETIIHKLVDRAQFALNPAVYAGGRSGFEGAADQSLFDVRLLYQEKMDAAFGRFLVPEERPFNSDLPAPRREVSLPENPLHIPNYDIVNVTGDVRTAYGELLPWLCREGDDAQYGSSVEHDVYALQAISRRVHYGALYVSESKFRQYPDLYRDLIRRGDAHALMDRLTRLDVESSILNRVSEKVDWLQAKADSRVRHIVDAEVIIGFYRDHVIPLTKKGEVLYLLNRREG